MSLRTILNRLASDAGYDLNTQRPYVLDNLNAFARDLHDSNNLTWCDREQLFLVDVSKEIMALPWQVAVFHAARDVDYNRNVSNVGLGPRYMIGTWRNIYQQYRVLRRSPIKREILSGTKLYVHLPTASASDITLNLIGKTTRASQDFEELIIPAGEQLVETVRVYEEITNNIEKTAESDVDLIVSLSEDPDDETSYLAEIPNHQTKSQYTLVQHDDFYTSRSENYIVECWYKHSFVPLINDFDNFVCNDVYDNALYLGAWGRLLSKTSDKAAEGVAMIAQAIGLAKNLSMQEAQSQDQEVSYPTNIIDSMHERPEWFMQRYYESHRPC